jgi:hypothetical protein
MRASSTRGLVVADRRGIGVPLGGQAAAVDAVVREPLLHGGGARHEGNASHQAIL